MRAIFPNERRKKKKPKLPSFSFPLFRFLTHVVKNGAGAAFVRMPRAHLAVSCFCHVLHTAAAAEAAAPWWFKSDTGPSTQHALG